MTDAKEYGKALFLITEEASTTESVIADVKLLKSVLSGNADYTKLLDTPALSKEEKIELISTAFSSLDENLVNLLKILSEKHCAYLFTKAADAYLVLYDESRGIERVEAVTAIALTEAQSAALKHKLEDKTGKTIIVKNTVDPSILGGVKLRYSGIQLDGSVKTRLEKFEDALKNIVI